MSTNVVTFTIDGVEVKSAPDKTIIQAADDAGIYIPRLCYLKDLPPGGHCRVCTVKVNGRPVNSCTYPVAEGIVVENDTEELNALRRNIIEMLFVEGNHFCPACEVAGKCELQALAYRLGLLTPQMPYLYAKKELDATHPDVYLDRNRCVLCGRCVRASIHLDKKNVFGFENRGINMKISVNSNDGLKDTNLTKDDKAMSVCPTGCLVVKRQGYLTPIGNRPYDKNPIGSEIETKKVKS